MDQLVPAAGQVVEYHYLARTRRVPVSLCCRCGVDLYAGCMRKKHPCLGWVKAALAVDDRHSGPAVARDPRGHQPWTVQLPQLTCTHVAWTLGVAAEIAAVGNLAMALAVAHSSVTSDQGCLSDNGCEPQSRVPERHLIWVAGDLRFVARAHGGYVMSVISLMGRLRPVLKAQHCFAGQ